MNSNGTDTGIGVNGDLGLFMASLRGTPTALKEQGILILDRPFDVCHCLEKYDQERLFRTIITPGQSGGYSVYDLTTAGSRVNAEDLQTAISVAKENIRATRAAGRYRIAFELLALGLLVAGGYTGLLYYINGILPPILPASMEY